MKKTFISIIMAALTISAFAAETAKVTIQLKSSNATYGNDEVVLKENSDRNATYESGYDAEKMMSQSNQYSVLVYGFVEGNPCGAIATDNLDGLKLGIATNKHDTDYKLVFKNVSGRALKLFDRVAGQLIDITENGEYDFTVDASLVGQKQINNRFEIGEPAPSLCFRYNELEVIGYAGKSLIVKEAASGTEIVNIPSLNVIYSKDLSDKHGRLIVVLDGKEIQIDATPDVTPAN